MRIPSRRCGLVLRLTLILAVLAAMASPGDSVAQGASDPARAADGEPESRYGRATVEAVQGEPFGFAHVCIEYRTDAWHYVPRRPLMSVDGPGKSPKPLYPVFTIRQTAAGREPLVGGRVAEAIDLWFAFEGTESFEITVWDGDSQHGVRVTPVRDPARHAALQHDWWRGKCAEGANIRRSRSHFPQVDNYVLGMLARRLGKELPKMQGPWSGGFGDEMLGLFVGTEEVRLAMQSKRLLATKGEAEAADQPLPTAVLPPQVPVPSFEAPTLEPLAGYVPEECFYIRFGSYTNYRWFRDFVADWGDDLRTRISTRGLDYGIATRLQTQLILPEDKLADLLGEQAVSDMALIGMDGFVREGAAIGVLLESRGTPLLGTALAGLRVSARQGNPAITEQSLDIGGKTVSFLSTPDNRIRSFYAAEGNVHLVTTSRAIVERFVESAAGTKSLAKLPEFQYARSKFPAEAGDAAFVYLSDPWFRQLVGPKYRTEMTRRMQAETDIELVQMARMAARLEGKSGDSLETLAKGGFLPGTTEKRPDGSRPLLTASGPGGGEVVTDSLRGGRGTFLPVPDVEVTGLTKSEVRAYGEFAEFYRRLYRRMDPVVAAIRREDLEEGRERIVLDVAITPYTNQGLGGLDRILGVATNRKLARVEGDLIRLEAQIGRMLGSSEGTAFAGLRDREVAFVLEERYARPAEQFPKGYYLGGSPAGVLSQLLQGTETGEPDGEGYASLPLGLLGEKGQWLRKHGDFVTLGSRKRVLEEVTPQLEIVPAERPAQIRLRLADLGASKAAPFFRAQSFLLDRSTGDANENLLHRLTQQLGVKQEDALTAAERLLGAKLICPFGGTYELDSEQRGTVRTKSTTWRSTAFRTERGWWRMETVPEAYESTVLKRFHGLDVEFRLSEGTLYSRTELVQDRTTKERR